MSRLARDPQPRTTTKTKKPSSPASAFTSVAAQLLLRRGGREANNGDSIEFFSDLRKRQPEPPASAQTERGGPGRPEDGRGRTRRRGSSAGSDELLASEIGKHDYDWLLTPPATPLWSPATSVSGHQQVSTARSGSEAHAKSNPRLGTPSGRDNKENATSRLSRSSSSANTPAIASSGVGHLSHARTLSSASVSSINTVVSNASLISSMTTLLSAASSPRTPGTAKSAWSTSRPRWEDKASSRKQQATGGSVVAARQPRPPSSSSSRSSTAGYPAPTSSRARAPGKPTSSSKSSTGQPARSREHATAGVSSPRWSTTASTTTQQGARTQVRKRADAAARSRLASTGSTGLHAPSSPTTQQTRDVHPTNTRGARPLPSLSSSSSNNAGGVKTRSAAAAKQTATGVPATTTSTTQRWQQTLAPAIAAARSARREVGSVNVGSPRKNNAAGRKTVTADNKQAAPQQRPSTAAAAAGSGGLARTASRPKSSHTHAPTTSNAGRRPQDAAKHGGGGPPHQAHHRKQPAAALLQQWSSRSVMSTRSRLGLTTGFNISRGQSIRPDKNGGRAADLAAAAARMITATGPEAFPSTRYDAMLLREDPRNLTWLRGCDEADDAGSGGGLDLVDDASLEQFDGGTAFRMI